MRLVAILTVCLFTFVGCTKQQAKDVLCDTGKTASGLLSAQIAVQLDCKNVDAIRADIEKQLVSLKICEAPKPAANLMSAKSAIGEAICKPVIDALAAGALTQIPAGWECKGGQVTDDLKLKLYAACTKAL